jgi:sugar phosphate isomerase/epimerase
MDLTASYLTLAGASFGQRARYGIAERSRAASVAGWAGIGVLNSEPWQDATDTPCPVRELEWAELGSSFTREDADAFCRIADHFGTVTRINAGCGIAGAAEMPDTVIARRLVTLADAVASRGITVCFEPVAFGPCWQPSRIMRVMSMAGRPNIGFLFDVWHVARARARGDHAAVPVPMITEIQLSGYAGAPHGEFAGAMNRGMTDARAMAELAALDRAGYAGPVDVEVTNARTRGMSLAADASATLPEGIPS